MRRRLPLYVLTPRSVHLDEPLSRGLARRRLRLMLKIRICQNMDFRGFSGGNTKYQTVAECPEEGEEGTHGNTAKLVMGSIDGIMVRRLAQTALPARVSNPDFSSPIDAMRSSPTTSHSFGISFAWISRHICYLTGRNLISPHALQVIL